MEGLEQRVSELEGDREKIKAILNIIIDFQPAAAALRARIEDDQSSAGFLE